MGLGVGRRRRKTEPAAQTDEVPVQGTGLTLGTAASTAARRNTARRAGG
jgi:hypothetical protein